MEKIFAKSGLNKIILAANQAHELFSSTEYNINFTRQWSGLPDEGIQYIVGPAN